MADIIQIRRGTAAQWTTTNPILADGEMGFETDGSKKGKLGNGVTAWNALPYSFSGDSLNVADQINAAAAKITPVDADHVAITDSAASNVLKKLSWVNIKSTLKTYFDTFYEAAFTKGNLVQGTNVTLTGTLTSRLVGTGNVTINAAAADVATSINAAASKTTPVDADNVGITDSAASNVLKKLSWANIKATLKTYFDTFYEAAFTKGNLIQGANVTLTGTLTNRLVGTGDVTINAASGGSSYDFYLDTGRYHFPLGSRTILVLSANGDTRFCPFHQMLFTDVNMVADRIAVSVTGAGANATLRLGIFTYSNGVMTLVHDAGTVSAATTGDKEITINVTLTKGKLYMLGVAKQGTDTVTMQGLNITNPLFFSSGSLGVFASDQNGWGTTGVTGTFAASYSGLNTERPPLMALRLQNV